MARPQIATQDDLLAAAGRVLDRDGMDAFTLSAVAREVGLTRAGIAFRYENARKLKLAVLDQRAQAFAARMNGLEVERGGNGLIKLAHFIGTMAHSPRALISFMAKSQAGYFDEDLLALEKQRAASLRSAIDRAMPEGLPDRGGAIDMFAAHLTGSLMAWAATHEENGGAFLVRRTRTWLAMTRIGYDADRPVGLRLGSA